MNQLMKDSAATNLARQLRETSGLGITMLARLSGVSRVRFYKWLEGGGIGPEKVPHVRSLIALFRELRPVFGDDLRGFVRSEGPTGRIEDLLQRGEMKAVMGLAVHPSALQGEKSAGSPPGGNGSPSGWIQPARRLAWGGSDAGGENRQFILDEFGASWRGPDRYVPGADSPEDDETAGIVHIVYER